MPHAELIDQMEDLLTRLEMIELGEDAQQVIAEVREKLKILRGYSHN